MIDLSKLSIPKFDIHTFSNYLTADNIKYIEPFFLMMTLKNYIYF